MAYASAISNNIQMIRRAHREAAPLHAARIAELKARNYRAAIERNLAAFCVAVAQMAEEKQAAKPARTRKATGEQKSPEVQLVERLCKMYNKNMFMRTKHPVRTDLMRVYSIILDLAQTYHWSEFSIAKWLEFAQEK